MVQIVLEMWKDYLDDSAEESFIEHSYYTQKFRVYKNGTLHTYENVNIVAVNT